MDHNCSLYHQYCKSCQRMTGIIIIALCNIRLILLYSGFKIEDAITYNLFNELRDDLTRSNDDVKIYRDAFIYASTTMVFHLFMSLVNLRLFKPI